MIRQVSEPLFHDSENPAAAVRTRAAELRRMARTLDELGVARCPLCRVMLVARLGRRGPMFVCRCPRRRAA